MSAILCIIFTLLFIKAINRFFDHVEKGFPIYPPARHNQPDILLSHNINSNRRGDL